MLDRFGSTTDMFVADRMAKDCLIFPASGVDLTAVAAMADVAVSRGSNAPAAPYFLFCKSLAEFRLGHYEEALKWAQRPAASSFVHPKAGGYAIIAMSQFQLNQLNEARAALAACQKIVAEQMPRPGQELGRDWRDWIIVQALHSEAMKLIDGEPVSPTPQGVASP
jgi:hypothetical protein